MVAIDGEDAELVMLMSAAFPVEVAVNKTLLLLAMADDHPVNEPEKE